MKKLVTMIASLALAVGCMLPQQLHAEEATETIVETKEALQEAIDNSDISAITLGADINYDIVIPNGKTVTLNLNGKTLTNVVSHTIDNKGTLIINGNGTVNNVSHQKSAIMNYGKVVLNGGIYKRSEEKGTAVPNQANGNSYYTLANLGTMEINDAVQVELNGTYSSLIENGYFSGAEEGKSNAILQINGGTFTGGKYTVKNDELGKTIINGGVFNNNCEQGSAVLNWHDLEINGGTFNAIAYAIYAEYYGPTGLGTVKVNGGDFTAPEILKNNANAKITLAGGVYSNNPGDFVVEGYKAYKSGNKYVVAPLATGITLSEKSLSLEEGSSKTITATLTPAETLEAVAWSSSDAKVATVKDGVITAIGAGKATITAKTENGIEATCTVTVTEPVKVETPSIDTTKPTDEIKVGVNDAKAEQVLGAVADQIIAGSKDFTDADTAKAVVEAAKAGKSITVVADVQKADTSNAEVKADAEKIQKELNALTAESENTATVAMYLDLNVQIKADDNVLGNITKLSEPVTLTVMIPEKLQAEGRTFYVLRVHDGTVEKLATTVKGSVLTFETDRFSTYALVYEDKKIDDNGTTPDPTPDKTVYNVVFVDMNGAVLRTEKVEANGTATAPAAPTVDGYRFVKWDTDFTNVTKDLLVKPIYEKVAAAETPDTKPEKPSSDSKSPNTGDTTNAGLFTAFALLGLVSMGIIIVQRKRKQLLK